MSEMAYQANTRDTAKSRISTDGVQLYGDESTIRLDFWNQSVSVKISPLKGPEDEGNGVYAYKKTISTAMSPDTAVVFGHLIEKDIIPALIAGEAKQIGIQSSKLNMVYISTGVEETGKIEPYIALFIGIDETRKPSKTAVFKFIDFVRSRRFFCVSSCISHTINSSAAVVFSECLSIPTETSVSATGIFLF